MSPLTIVEWIIDLCLEYKKSWRAFLVLLLSLATVVAIHYFIENSGTALLVSLVVFVLINGVAWKMDQNNKKSNDS